MNACMGGFCVQREKCANHMDPPSRAAPAERLCGKGQERPMTWTHIAAMNLIADHDAGVSANPVKLDAARKLLGSVVNADRSPA